MPGRGLVTTTWNLKIKEVVAAIGKQNTLSACCRWGWFRNAFSSLIVKWKELDDKFKLGITVREAHTSDQVTQYVSVCHCVIKCHPSIDTNTHTQSVISLGFFDSTDIYFHVSRPCSVENWTEFLHYGTFSRLHLVAVSNSFSPLSSIAVHSIQSK